MLESEAKTYSFNGELLPHTKDKAGSSTGSSRILMLRMGQMLLEMDLNPAKGWVKSKFYKEKSIGFINYYYCFRSEFIVR